ncbi:hypothetical protein ACZ90_11520 [Streptomyces albus subsp. albus]|nr:hypothetical protein ACZ90_11520 [Streptomyces albus subsp. albus]
MTAQPAAAPAPRPAGTADRRTASWQRKRRQLLDAAAEVFFRHGLDGGTTKKIAERAGLSQSSVYHYFSSKEEILGEIARQVYRDFTAALDQALSGPEQDPARRLGQVVDAFVGSLVPNQHTFAVYWQQYRSIPADIAQEARAAERAFVRRVEEVVAAAQREGVLPAGHATQILTEGILGMMSWTYWWYRPARHTPQQVAAAFRDLIGLHPQAASSAPAPGGEAARIHDHERRRRELIATAAEVFFRRGFDAGSTTEIAQRAGVSQSTIYHYFSSKEQLLEEIARQVYGDFTSALDRALAGERTAGTQLGQVIDIFLGSLVDNQRTFAVYWKENRSLPADVAREARERERAYVQRVEHIVAAAQREGVLPTGHATQILTEGILGMMSWTHWWYRPARHTPQQVAAAFRDLLRIGGTAGAGRD